MWTLIIASDLVAYQYNRGWTLVAVVLGGLVADYLVLKLRPSAERVTMFRTFAAFAPVALWAIYFIVLAIAYDIGWPVELAVGVGIVSSMSILLLAYLMIPTPVRLLAEAEAEAPVATVEAPVRAG
jgi:hypothetical protein